MTATPTFSARDNVPGCGWEVAGDDIELLCDAAWDHIIDDHPYDAAGNYHVSYTHVSCGGPWPDVMAMKWHLFFGCRGVMAEVES